MLLEDKILKTFIAGEQPDIVDTWIEKASFINRICKEFFVVNNLKMLTIFLKDHLQACDKMTHMNNRDLLFDLNSYLNNVRVILHGCNNYLKVLLQLKYKHHPHNGLVFISGLVQIIARSQSAMVQVQLVFQEVLLVT